MKAEIFVVAFCLLFAGAYFTYKSHTGPRRNESKIVINSDNDHEEINHAGKIIFSDDEKEIESISPGGYIFYRKNDESFSAESNAHGEISYTQYDGKEKMALDSSGRKLVAEAIHEMIAWGFDARERMERLYKKGGNPALIGEISNLKNEDIKRMYLQRLLAPDSVSSGDLIKLLEMVRTSLNEDEEKSRLLKKLNPLKLRDTAVSRAYLAAVESTNNEFERGMLLKDIVGKTAYPDVQLGHIMDMIAGLGPDIDREQLITALLKKKNFPDELFDKLVDMIGHFNDMEKENLFKELVNAGDMSEAHWLRLLGESVKFGSDTDKSGLLLQFAKKMPKTECLRSAYLDAAKTISGDMEFGKVVRVME